MQYHLPLVIIYPSPPPAAIAAPDDVPLFPVVDLTPAFIPFPSFLLYLHIGSSIEK